MLVGGCGGAGVAFVVNLLAIFKSENLIFVLIVPCLHKVLFENVCQLGLNWHWEFEVFYQLLLALCRILGFSDVAVSLSPFLHLFQEDVLVFMERVEAAVLVHGRRGGGRVLDCCGFRLLRFNFTFYLLV